MGLALRHSEQAKDYYAAVRSFVVEAAQSPIPGCAPALRQLDRMKPAWMTGLVAATNAELGSD